MDGAFRTCQQAGAYLNAAGSQRKGRGKLSPIRDTTGSDDRHIHRIHHLGNQGHGGHFAHVAAGLRTFRDDGVRTGAHQAAGQNCSRHHRDHFDARRFPLLDVLSGIACACGDHRDLFFDDDLSQFIHAGVHQHKIDAKGLIRERFVHADLLSQLLSGLHTARGDDAQRTGIGTGSGEFAGGNVGHAALYDWKLRS